MGRRFRSKQICNIEKERRNDIIRLQPKLHIQHNIKHKKNQKSMIKNILLMHFDIFIQNSRRFFLILYNMFTKIKLVIIILLICIYWLPIYIYNRYKLYKERIFDKNELIEQDYMSSHTRLQGLVYRTGQRYVSDHNIQCIICWEYADTCVNVNICSCKRTNTNTKNWCKMINCNHYFHIDCIDKWVDKILSYYIYDPLPHIKCPICNR